MNMNRRKIWLAILVLIAVILIIYLATKKKTEAPSPEDVAQVTNDTVTGTVATTTATTTTKPITATTTTSASIPANWQTIVFGGATFRYPPGWQRFQKNFEIKIGTGKYYTKDYIFSTDYPSFEIIFGLTEPYAGANDPYTLYDIKKVKGVYFALAKDAPKAEKDIFAKIVGSVK